MGGSLCIKNIYALKILKGVMRDFILGYIWGVLQVVGGV